MSHGAGTLGEATLIQRSIKAGAPREFFAPAFAPPKKATTNERRMMMKHKLLKSQHGGGKNRAVNMEEGVFKK